MRSKGENEEREETEKMRRGKEQRRGEGRGGEGRSSGEGKVHKHHTFCSVSHLITAGWLGHGLPGGGVPV